MWTNERTYFNRDCNVAQTFGKDKPCLCLNYVCWMDPWAIIEKVKIPNYES